MISSSSSSSVDADALLLADVVVVVVVVVAAGTNAIATETNKPFVCTAASESASDIELILAACSLAPPPPPATLFLLLLTVEFDDDDDERGCENFVEGDETVCDVIWINDRGYDVETMTGSNKLSIESSIDFVLGPAPPPDDEERGETLNSRVARSTISSRNLTSAGPVTLDNTDTSPEFTSQWQLE